MCTLSQLGFNLSSILIQSLLFNALSHQTIQLHQAKNCTCEDACSAPAEIYFLRFASASASSNCHLLPISSVRDRCFPSRNTIASKGIFSVSYHLGGLLR